MSGIPPIGAGGTETGLRVSYNTKEQKFEPMGGGKLGQLEHMVKVEGQINKLKVPTDFTSPTFLQKVAPPCEAKGKPIKMDTQGVKEFFGGNAALLSRFTAAILKAQRSI
jgi:hypothetical protein